MIGNNSAWIKKMNKSDEQQWSRYLVQKWWNKTVTILLLICNLIIITNILNKWSLHKFLALSPYNQTIYRGDIYRLLFLSVILRKRWMWAIHGFTCIGRTMLFSLRFEHEIIFELLPNMTEFCIVRLWEYFILQHLIILPSLNLGPYLAHIIIDSAIISAHLPFTRGTHIKKNLCLCPCIANILWKICIFGILSMLCMQLKNTN